MTKAIQLGKRLSEIAKLVTRAQPLFQYDHIWDCCCDHGYLGMYLLDQLSKRNQAQVQINFVDQVSHITEQLRSRLRQSTGSNYRVFTLDAGKLQFDINKRHCIIIAGVTTNGTLKLLQNILNKHPKQSLDFILCPTRGQYELRQNLIKLKVELLSEAYLEENGRHYELLYVRHNENHNHLNYKQISSVGAFWQKGHEGHLSYLLNRISHYQMETLDPGKTGAFKALQLYSEMYQQTNSTSSS